MESLEKNKSEALTPQDYEAPVIEIVEVKLKGFDGPGPNPDPTPPF